MGSAGAKAMAVLLGTGDVYLHAGGQYEWDNCAPAAVALSAGLNATRLDGAPLEYNRPDPRLPDLLICPPALAGPVQAALGCPHGGVGTAEGPAPPGDPWGGHRAPAIAAFPPGHAATEPGRRRGEA